MGAGFGRFLTLGVEEELFLVDRGTLAAAPVFSRIVPDPGPRLKAELFACLVETTTPPCKTAAEALESLAALRGEIARRAEAEGATILASGTHPLAEGARQPIVPKRRYRDMLAELGDSVYRQLVCGLHVHVGMPSEEACLRALEGVLPWLPLLLQLSANSPFVEGADSGARSARAGRLAELPSVGAPPFLRTWADWEEATAGLDYTRIWWDARPHPRYGTLEVRLADQQTDVRRSAGFAAIVQALASAAAGGPHAPYDRELYARRREEAARTPPSPREIELLAALVEPEARRLHGWELAEEVLHGEPEAVRQLAVAEKAGLEATVRDLAARSLA